MISRYSLSFNFQEIKTVTKSTAKEQINPFHAIVVGGAILLTKINYILGHAGKYVISIIMKFFKE